MNWWWAAGLVVGYLFAVFCYEGMPKIRNRLLAWREDRRLEEAWRRTAEPVRLNDLPRYPHAVWLEDQLFPRLSARPDPEWPWPAVPDCAR